MNRFSEFRFKNGRITNNRVVVPAMASSTATEDGVVTLETEAHYHKLSQSGAGIIFVEYTYVHLSGRSEAHQLGIDNDSKLPELKKISQILKNSGAIPGIQLTHAGGKSSSSLTGRPLMAPSTIPVPVKESQMETPREMTETEITFWKESFLQAAKRAVEAGFELIELHSAHGYGLNQWLSPITNHRSDLYGGTLENRLRLLSEIIIAIKKLFPRILLSVRIPGRDFLERGIDSEEAIQVAMHLEKLGVDILNVSSGIGGWRRPLDRQGQGYLVPEAKVIQEMVSIPVIGVGGIESGDYVDELIESRSLSFAAIGRAILSNPIEWNIKNLRVGQQI